MKTKIFMILAAFSLLTLSLNAQELAEVQVAKHQLNSVQLKDLGKLSKTDAAQLKFNDVVRGSIEGMSSILPEGTMRAPKRYDATEYYTVGPFEGDNFDFGFGFPAAYDANQDVTITTQLQQSEYEDHIGDEIVGFRLALYGDGNSVAKVDEFVVHPTTSTSILNGGYAWTLKDLTYENPGSGGGSQTIEQYVRVNSSADLTSGQYLIVNESGSKAFNGGSSNPGGSGSNAIDVTISNATIAADETTDAANVTIDVSAGTIRTASGLYIYRITGTGGGMTTSGNNPGYQQSFSISGGNATITCPGTTNTYYLRYNTQSSQFRYYTSASQQPVQLYKRVTTTGGGSGGVITNNVTINPISSNDVVRTTTVDNVTINTTSGDLAYSTYMRLSGTVTLSTTEGRITKIVFNGQSTSYPVSRLSTTTGSYATANNVGTWTGSASSVVFTASSQVRCTSVVVTVEKDIPTSGSVDGNYVNLRTGQWHEFYLDQPVEFQMPSEATSMLMGYDYLQYPSSNTTQMLNPAAFNSQSTGHNHYVHMIQGSSNPSVGDITISLPGGWNVSFYIIAVYDGDTGNLLTYWTGDGAIAGTYGTNNTPYYALPTGWSLTGAAYLAQEQVNAGEDTYNFGYVSTSGQASINIANSALQGKTNVEVYIVAVAWEDNESIIVNGNTQAVENSAFTEIDLENIFGVPVEGWFGFNTNPAGDLAVQLIFKESKLEAQPPTVSSQVGDENVTITITPDPNTDGDLVYYVVDQNNQQTQSLTFPRGPEDYTVTVHAYTTAGDEYKASSETVQEVTIPKLVTPTPSVVTTMDDGAVYINGDGLGEVHVYVNGVEVDPNDLPYVAGRGRTDYTVTVTVTAQEPGKAMSTYTEEVTVPASTLPWTADPTFDTDVQELNVGITAVGDGNVIMYDEYGHVINNPTYFERLDHDYYVTVSATAQEEGHGMSNTVTETILIPALTSTPDMSDWNVLNNEKDPEHITDTYANSDVITWGNQVMFLDRFTASTAENTHPEEYTYKMTEKKSEGRSTNERDVPVLHTGSTVNGYYTLQDVEADKDRAHVDLNVMNSFIEMRLRPEDIYYYTLDRSKNSTANNDYIEISKLQRSGNIYAEMGDYYPQIQHNYGIVERFDTINYSKTGDQGIDGKHYGTYGGTTFMSYVPIVWTRGNAEGNVRSDWGKVISVEPLIHDYTNNSYGSPVWKTGVGKVMINSVDVVRQQGRWATWTDSNGEDCSLYRARVNAYGYLPKPKTDDDPIGTNVNYEPYMFRIWVQCSSLRGFVKDEHVIVDGDTIHVGTGVLLDDPTFDSSQSLMWLADVPVDPEAIIMGNVSPLDYGDVANHPSNENYDYSYDLVFGATEATEATDVKLIVRFYYRTSIGNSSILPDDNGKKQLRADPDDETARSYYAAEDDDEPDDIPVAIYELYYDNFHGSVVDVTYYNVVGQQSSKPFDGINIVVKRYSDGTTSSTKVLY